MTLIAALEAYRQARQDLLASLGLPMSNRDPLAEISEHLVAALTGATLAPSRVQADYDLILPDEQKIQVRYLANPTGTWVNEHLITRLPNVEWYALVLFEAFTLQGVLALPTAELAPIGAALGKRHPRQDEMLRFTHRNWCTIRGHPERFREMGVRVWRSPFA
ncbi:hypothetical protein [Micromonospora okii]|uniref:hypothetical protein n=1 Tax=Micromonospora okii TaxID=1182970 RepID=UPI001E503740|nr:hypothetical protein [Micromonospora okii]